MCGPNCYSDFMAGHYPQPNRAPWRNSWNQLRHIALSTNEMQTGNRQQNAPEQSESLPRPARSGSWTLPRVKGRCGAR